MSKGSDTVKSMIACKIIYLDLLKVTVAKPDGSEFDLNQRWVKIAVDEATGKKWSNFSKTKNEMVKPMCEFLHQIKTRDNAIKIIRLDPAGDNHKLEKRRATVDWKELQPIEFEFTSQDTPQHNNLAELVYPYLGGKA